MLSNTDIIRELNKNIFIYPLISENIKGSTVNLTASKWAWSLKSKRTAVVHNATTDKYEIVIEAKDTVLIETEEVIHVTRKISGTYHSKVKLVSNGLGHIGTTLDPHFCGNSLIAIQNNSDADYNLPVGESFVSLIFYSMRSKSFGRNTNLHGQTQILTTIGISIPPELDEDWRKTPEGIIEKCKSNDEIKKITKLKDSISYIKSKSIPYLIFSVILLIIGSCFKFFKPDSFDTVFLSATFLPAIVGIFLNKFNNQN